MCCAPTSDFLSPQPLRDAPTPIFSYFNNINLTPTHLNLIDDGYNIYFLEDYSYQSQNIIKLISP